MDGGNSNFQMNYMQSPDYLEWWGLPHLSIVIILFWFTPFVSFQIVFLMYPCVFFYNSLQAQNYCQFQTYSDDYHRKLHFLVGVTIWLIGFLINLQSDSILRNLRNNTSDIHTSSSSSTRTTTSTEAIANTIPKYKIPYGGFFHYVSCANFFGEIFEWFGYAIASSSIAAWAFWLFVCANLIPRGIAHHQWYLQKFEEYPKDRYAVIPFVF